MDIDNGDLIFMLLQMNKKIVEQNEDIMSQNIKLVDAINQYLPEQQEPTRLRIVKNENTTRSNPRN